jgi:hypothetical protein
MDPDQDLQPWSKHLIKMKLLRHLCLKDGLNPQCFAATIFIYFASLSGAIAFGGLMGTKTRDDIGIPETLLGKISTKIVLF